MGESIEAVEHSATRARTLRLVCSAMVSLSEFLVNPSLLTFSVKRDYITTRRAVPLVNSITLSARQLSTTLIHSYVRFMSLQLCPAIQTLQSGPE